MTLEGPDGMRHLVWNDGSLVMDGDEHARPIRLDELTPESAQIVRALIEAVDAADGRRRDESVARDPRARAVRRSRPTARG